MFRKRITKQNALYTDCIYTAGTRVKEREIDAHRRRGLDLRRVATSKGWARPTCCPGARYLFAWQRQIVARVLQIMELLRWFCVSVPEEWTKRQYTLISLSIGVAATTDEHS